MKFMLYIMKLKIINLSEEGCFFILVRNIYEQVKYTIYNVEKLYKELFRQLNCLQVLVSTFKNPPLSIYSQVFASFFLNKLILNLGWSC